MKVKILEAACAFCVRGVQNSGSGAEQTEKKKQNKTKQNQRGNKLYPILRSFFQVTILTFLLIKLLIKGYSSYR